MENASLPVCLIVDDDLNVATILGMMMAKINWHCIRASSATEAIAIAEATPGIAMTMMDLDLPDMSGLQLFDHIRRIAFDMPVVVVSGCADFAPEVQRILERGALAFLQKPFNFAQLRSTVDACQAACT
jgi:FixJ family two-component response regulator